MSDPHRYLRALTGPPAPAEAPAWPAEQPARRGWVLALAAAATVLVVSLGGAAALRAAFEAPAPTLQPGWTLRGPEAPAAVDLRLAVQRDGVLQRAGLGETYAVGDRVFLQVAASQPSQVTVWVEHQDARESLGAQQALRQPADLRSDGGLVAYDLGESGIFGFCASTVDNERCEPPSCSCWQLEVR